MKAMFLMDFVTVKKLLRRYLLLLLGVGGLAALMMGSHPGIVPYFGELSVISVAQALALYDDRRAPARASCSGATRSSQPSPWRAR